MTYAISPHARPATALNGVIFDVDGVLWDTTDSYDQAIFRTLDHLLETVGKSEFRGRVTHSDLRAMRRAGRLNSDWDLTYVLLEALLSGYGDLADAARDTGGRGAAWAFDRRGAASKLEFAILQRWFDLVYWGDVDFDRLIGGPRPPLPRQEGTWRQERPLIQPRILDEIQALDNPALAIATGRPWLELQTVLDSSTLLDYIAKTAICTADILEKPDPEVIRWCLARMRNLHGTDGTVSSVLFCGDTRDDLQLVLNYRGWQAREPADHLWLGAVSVVDESEFDFFLNAGADACIDHIRHLPRVMRKLNQRVQA